MESMESYVPPGFRFHPTDEELIGYYLRKKIASQKIDLDVIREIDLYRIEPWDLQERCRIGYEEQNEWYFFSHKDKKYPTGTRTNRATVAGFWKATGRDKAVYDKTKLIGMRKTLVFYKGRAPNGQKTDWIMHEYRLESDENALPQEEGWVVCRAFKKRSSGHTNKSIEGWDQAYFYDDPSGMGSATDPANFNFIPQHNQYGLISSSPHFPCKQETEGDNLHFINNNHNSDQFLQLPQLESPILAARKRPISCVYDELEAGFQQSSSKKLVTDWRALDKFVASQLSHEQMYNSNNGGDVHHGDSTNNNNSIDLTPTFTSVTGSSICSDQTPFLLLHSGGRDGTNNSIMSGFLGPAGDYDIGMCVFDK